MASDWEQIGFADARHGVAIRSGGQALRTSDAGLSWQPLGSAELALPSLAGADVRCWADGCAVGGLIAWTGRSFAPEHFAPSNPGAPAREATAKPSSPPSTPLQNRPLGGKLSTFTCEPKPSVDSLSLVANLLGLAKHSEPSTRATISRAPTVGGLVERAHAGLTWRGHDERGDFRVQTAPLQGPGAELARPDVELLPQSFSAHSSVAWFPRFVARRFAIFMRVGDGLTQGFLVYNDGRTELLGPGSRSWLDAVPAPGSGALLSIKADQHVTVLLLDDGGKLVARRWFVFGGEEPSFLAFGPSGPGLALALPEGTAFYSLVPGAPPLSLPTVPAARKGALPICAKPHARTVTSLFMPDAVQMRINSISPEPRSYEDDWVPASKAQAIVELAPEGVCLRGALIGALFAASLQADGGALRGTLVGPRTSHALTCHESTDAFEP